MKTSSVLLDLSTKSSGGVTAEQLAEKKTIVNIDIVGNTMSFNLDDGGTIDVDVTSFLADSFMSGAVYDEASKSIVISMTDGADISIPLDKLLMSNTDSSITGDGAATPLSVKISTDQKNTLKSGSDGGLYSELVDPPKKNKTLSYSMTANQRFDNGPAKLLMRTGTYTMNHEKKIELGLNIPTRHDGKDWGGLYINTNIEVNGTWYNLGNEGYGGASMVSNASTIATFVSNKILDIVNELGLTADYELRVELMARTHSGKTIVNQSHDINCMRKNLNKRGALQTWASNQNFATIYIKEID